MQWPGPWTEEKDEGLSLWDQGELAVTALQLPRLAKPHLGHSFRCPVVLGLHVCCDNLPFVCLSPSEAPGFLSLIEFRLLLVPPAPLPLPPSQTIHTVMSKDENLPKSCVTQISALRRKSSLPSWKRMVEPLQERAETAGWLSFSYGQGPGSRAVWEGLSPFIDISLFLLGLAHTPSSFRYAHSTHTDVRD